MTARGWSRFAPIAAAAALCACTPFYTTPVIGRFFLPTYYRYLENPRFSFDYPRVWGTPKVSGGSVVMRPPDAAVEIMVGFQDKSAASFVPPDRLKQDLAALGSVEDAHRLDEVAVSSRTAYRVRYTTHRYDPQYLLGAKSDVTLSEAIFVAEPHGNVLIAYRAPVDAFWKKKYRRRYEHFLESLVIAAPVKPVRRYVPPQ
ncbi:MAG: hypothetical protein HY078_13180 [Elusimicrobia bacterium]|nr:hypothetical protein [Elusimicrobiota bacterium]